MIVVVQQVEVICSKRGGGAISDETVSREGCAISWNRDWGRKVKTTQDEKEEPQLTFLWSSRSPFGPPETLDTNLGKKFNLGTQLKIWYKFKYSIKNFLNLGIHLKIPTSLGTN